MLTSQIDCGGCAHDFVHLYFYQVHKCVIIANTASNSTYYCKRKKRKEKKEYMDNVGAEYFFALIVSPTPMGYFITAHHLYMFLKSCEGFQCGGCINKQKNKPLS